MNRYTMQKEENKWTDIPCRREQMDRYTLQNRTNGQIYHAEENKWTDIPCRREQMDRYTMQKRTN